ncbi:thioesterase family protein [Microbacterium esteraromaticum]|uniref:thioesterase family protein n=1 Tax=Microbacterium esteraromaticum TaxID=57043 RepID=UPI0019D3E86E|nr:thioesterase family protein [Microbacterium esteraromaticum]MBN7793202.1 thioesterase family protein [Microbacterium esteraromaticum]
MSCYFRRLSATEFEPTDHVGGAWNPDEQHVAPVLGLLAHIIEADHAVRRADTPLVLARANYDILGVIPMAAFEVSTRVVRPGRTIELVEATLIQGGRAALTLRAWMLQTGDTADLAGTSLASMPPRADLAGWRMDAGWQGGAIRSVEFRHRDFGPGRAQSWLRPTVPLLADEAVSARARMLGALDFANGIAIRVSPNDLLYPNVDLTASLFREPRGEWIGLDTSVSFGPDGIGLTESVLSDEAGPLGTSSQTLTLRRR